MPINKPANLAIPLLVVLNICSWVFFGPAVRFHLDRQMLAEILASTAIILLSCALTLTIRLPFLERWFGGLDQMYLDHQRSAIIAMSLILLHIFTIPKFRHGILPGSPLSAIAILGMGMLVLLSIAPRIPILNKLVLPYDRWRKVHRLIGVFCIVGFAHAMLVDSLVRKTTVPFVLLIAMFSIGTAAYLYTEFIARFLPACINC